MECFSAHRYMCRLNLAMASEVNRSNINCLESGAVPPNFLCVSTVDQTERGIAKWGVRRMGSTTDMGTTP